MLDEVKITTLMEIHGMSMKQMGELIGLSKSMCYWLLQDKRDMKVKWLRVWATRFNVSMDELWKEKT